MPKVEEKVAELGIAYRWIDGVFCQCVDMGCPDFLEAKRNREREWTEEQLQWWGWYERTVALTPLCKPFPSGIPLGRLPLVGKGARGQHRDEDREGE